MNSSPERIALFVPSLRGGGAERVMVTLANGIATSEYKVDLVLAQAKGPYLKDVNSRVRVVDLGVSRVLFAIPQLCQYLRRNRPKAMISALSHANIIALIAQMMSRTSTKVIVAEHNTNLHSKRCDIPLRGQFIPFLMRILYPYSDKVVAVSSGVANDLMININISQEHVKVIFNPVVSDLIMLQSKKQVPHPWLGDINVPVILAIGSFTEAKDFNTLISSFNRVRKKRKAKLIILGEGPLRNSMENKISNFGLEDDVLLPGFVDNPYRWLRYATLFVLSSAWEGLPTVLIEAMACGVQVVSTDCHSGPAEILENGKWGRLVPVGNVEKLAKSIEETIDDKILKNVVKRAEDFSVEKSVQSYVELLASLN